MEDVKAVELWNEGWIVLCWREERKISREKRLTSRAVSLSDDVLNECANKPSDIEGCCCCDYSCGCGLRRRGTSFLWLTLYSLPLAASPDPAKRSLAGYLKGIEEVAMVGSCDPVGDQNNPMFVADGLFGELKQRSRPGQSERERPS